MVQTRVSNGTGQCNFSGQRDRQKCFVPGQRDNGTEVPSLSQDKGTTGQGQNLVKGRAGPGQPKFGTGRDSQKPGQDTGQNIFVCPAVPKSCTVPSHWKPYWTPIGNLLRICRSRFLGIFWQKIPKQRYFQS